MTRSKSSSRPLGDSEGAMPWPLYWYMFADNMFEEPNFLETLSVLQMMLSTKYLPHANHILRVYALAMCPSLLRLGDQETNDRITDNEITYGPLCNGTDDELSQKAFELLRTWIATHGPRETLSVLPGYSTVLLSDLVVSKKDTLDSTSSNENIDKDSKEFSTQNTDVTRRNTRQKKSNIQSNKRKIVKASAMDSDQIVQAMEAELKVARCADVWDIVAGATSNQYFQATIGTWVITEENGWRMLEFLVDAFELEASQDESKISMDLLRQFPKPDMGPRAKLDKALEIIFEPFILTRAGAGPTPISVGFDDVRKRELALKLLKLIYDLVDSGEVDGDVLRRALLVKLNDLEQDEFHHFISLLAPTNIKRKMELLEGYLESSSNPLESEIPDSQERVGIRSAVNIRKNLSTEGHDTLATSQTRVTERVEPWSLDIMKKYFNRSLKDGLEDVHNGDSNSNNNNSNNIQASTVPVAQGRRSRVRIQWKRRGIAELKYSIVKLEILRLENMLYEQMYGKMEREKEDIMMQWKAFFNQIKSIMEELKLSRRRRFERALLEDEDIMVKLTAVETLESIELQTMW